MVFGPDKMTTKKTKTRKEGKTKELLLQIQGLRRENKMLRLILLPLKRAYHALETENAELRKAKNG